MACTATAVTQTAEAFRDAFGRLAADKLFDNAARVAHQLALAIASAYDLNEFYAISRYARRAQPEGDRTAPLACYLEGLHFHRVHGSHDLADLDFEALKEAAWNYLDFLDGL